MVVVVVVEVLKKEESLFSPFLSEILAAFIGAPPSLGTSWWRGGCACANTRSKGRWFPG